MKKILFIRSEKANLPEIDAYINYFNKTEKYQAFDTRNIINKIDYNHYDVIWEFKGFGGTKTNNQIVVHDYASLSTGKFPILKNNFKKIINPKPDVRIFLNEHVRNGFNFKDGVDYFYRDMGIDKTFSNIRNENKEFDFVYIGAMSKDREINKLLDNFKSNDSGKICLVGDVENDLYNSHKNNSNIVFTGKVPYLDVPSIASSALYGINYVPNKYPYNIQTSTKLIEYLALGLNVITTDYSWVRNFEKKYNCNFYKINESNFSIDLKKLESFHFENNLVVEDFLWDSIINKSGIERKLDSLFL